MIEEHPGPLTYDLRTRAGLSIRELGENVPWDESIWLVEELLTDPTAHLTAAVLQWAHPVSWEWVLSALQYDLTVAINSKKSAKPSPLARPWDPKPATRATTVSPEAKARLRQMARGEVLAGGG